MKKFILSLFLIGLGVCQISAQDASPCKGCSEAIQTQSVVEKYQSQCPFNAADFCSNEAVVTALIPPTSPLTIKLEVAWPYQTMKEQLEKMWFEHIDEILPEMLDADGFRQCAFACYNLQVPMVMEYYSTIDKKSVTTPISVEQLNKLFDKKIKDGELPAPIK